MTTSSRLKESAKARATTKQSRFTRSAEARTRAMMTPSRFPGAGNNAKSLHEIGGGAEADDADKSVHGFGGGAGGYDVKSIHGIGGGAYDVDGEGGIDRPTETP